MIDPEDLMPDEGSTPEEYFDKLLLAGVVEVSGVDDKGELTYSFSDKMEKLSKEALDKIDEQFYQEVMRLWERGFVKMNMLEDNPLVTLTEKAMDEEARDKLPLRLKSTLSYIMKALGI